MFVSSHEQTTNFTFNGLNIHINSKNISNDHHNTLSCHYSKEFEKIIQTFYFLEIYNSTQN